MIELTVFERQLRKELLRMAAEGTPTDPLASLVTYGALGELVDPQGLRSSGPTPHTRHSMWGFNEALGHVSMYEVEHGRPMLSALVVAKDTQRPGEGFAKLARHLGFQFEDDESFFLEELVLVLEFWTSDDPTTAIDAALEVVMTELISIKVLIRKTARGGDMERSK